MSAKERIVFLDRAAFDAGELPIPRFDHNWSEYPQTEEADIVPRLFWATTAITHACPLDAAALAQLHKLQRVIVTGPAAVDDAACAARGVVVRRLAAEEASAAGLVNLLEAMVESAAQ